MTHIQYWLGDEVYAKRHRKLVPRTGDRVRLSGVIYTVCLVVWIEDEGVRYPMGEGHVNIELMAETMPMPAGACFERPRDPEPPLVKPAADDKPTTKRRRK